MDHTATGQLMEAVIPFSVNTALNIEPTRTGRHTLQHETRPTLDTHMCSNHDITSVDYPILDCDWLTSYLICLF